MTEIIIDTDPGIDDALALLLALAAPDALKLRAITVVAGNVALASAARNACRVVELAGRRGVPVHAGCAGPWLRALETAEDVHGADGLGGAALPPPTLSLAATHAVDAILHVLETAADHSVTLCALAPLTNIATALVCAPSLAMKIRAIVLMGGAIGLGNVTPAAEFNFYVDPHAAARVFASGVPIVMIPLEATHQALATPAWVEAVRELGTRTSGAIAEMLAPGLERSAKRRRAGVPVHDACVIGYLLWPELFHTIHGHVAIETHSALTMGRSVVDLRGRLGLGANATVVESIEVDPFFVRMRERLAALP